MSPASQLQSNLRLLLQSPTKAGTASVRGALWLHTVCSHAVAAHARVVKLIRRFAGGFLIPRLRCPVGGLSGVRELLRKLDPVQIRHRNGFAIFATPAGSEHERGGLRDGYCSIVDHFPSSINTASPREPIDRSRRSCGVGCRLSSSRVDALNAKKKVGARKQDAPHHLGDIAGSRQRQWRRDSRGSRLYGGSSREVHTLQGGLVQNEFRVAAGELAHLKDVSQHVRRFL